VIPKEVFRRVEKEASRVARECAPILQGITRQYMALFLQEGLPRMVAMESGGALTLQLSEAALAATLMIFHQELTDEEIAQKLRVVSEEMITSLVETGALQALRRAVKEATT
jgi:hypothetical protein